MNRTLNMFETAVTNPVAVVSPEWPACEACQGSGKYSRGRFVGMCFRCKGQGRIEPKAAPAQMPSDKLLAAMMKARASKKAPIVREPKMRFKGFDATLAKPGSANPGAVYFKASQPDASGETYLGKLVAGMFYPTKRCDAVMTAAIQAVMLDPLPAAVAYGAETCHCSCCGILLTDPESIARKIGPICAERFGF